jgi:hypothetical protein
VFDDGEERSCPWQLGSTNKPAGCCSGNDVDDAIDLCSSDDNSNEDADEDADDPNENDDADGDREPTCKRRKLAEDKDLPIPEADSNEADTLNELD